jgi:hypothetical protein
MQVMSEKKFNGCKVFSATMAQERESLGERVTSWMNNYPDYEIVDIIPKQSSDEAFHCISILVFYYDSLVDR